MNKININDKKQTDKQKEQKLLDQTLKKLMSLTEACISTAAQAGYSFQSFFMVSVDERITRNRSSRENDEKS